MSQANDITVQYNEGLITMAEALGKLVLISQQALEEIAYLQQVMANSEASND